MDRQRWDEACKNAGLYNLVTLINNEVSSIVKPWGAIDFNHPVFGMQRYLKQKGKAATVAKQIDDRTSTYSDLAVIERALEDEITLGDHMFMSLCVIAEDSIEYNSLSGSHDAFRRWVQAVAKSRVAAQDGKIKEVDEDTRARLSGLFLGIMDMQMQNSGSGLITILEEVHLTITLFTRL